jgi:hypothetical protein
MFPNRDKILNSRDDGQGKQSSFAIKTENGLSFFPSYTGKIQEELLPVSEVTI